MSLFAFILIALVTMHNAKERRARFQSHRERGQMGFKWSRKQQMNVESGPINTETAEADSTEFGSNEIEPENEFTSTSTPYVDENDADIPESDGIPEPTSNMEIDQVPPVVIDNTVEPEIDIEPFTTMEEEKEEEHHHHQAPIMNCLYDKCHDIFNSCFNNKQCKEFMRKWQETQSLSYQCLPTTTTTTTTASADGIITDESMVIEQGGDVGVDNTEYPINTSSEYQDENQEECEYDELFWNTYHCGVENYCYNDQLVLASSHQYLLSPSNFRVSPTNVVGSNTSSSSSSFDYTLIMVALTSGISAVILVEVLRRLYIGFKDKCKCTYNGCNGCKGCSNSFRYLHNKWDQIRGYKYEKTHDDLTAIEEDDDDAIYGSNDLQTGNGTIGVTYNGVINDDSSVSDDEELQKCSSKPISLHQQTDEDADIHSDNDELNVSQQEQSKQNENDQNNDEQKDTEELVEQSTSLSAPTQQL